MKYDRMLEKLKKEQNAYRIGVASAFLIVIIAMIRFAAKFGGVLPWIGVLVLVAVMILFLRGLGNHEKKILEMRQSVGALNSADFIRMVEQSQDFEDLYFVHDQFFLNFFTCCAYPRSEISSVRTYDDRNDDTGTIRNYCMYVYYSGGKSDRIVCDSMRTRDRIAELLRGKS